MSLIAVRRATAEMEAAGACIAAQLGIPNLCVGDENPNFPLILEARRDGLVIIPSDRSLGRELCIDFVSGPTAYRRLAAGSKRQPLARAIGLAQGYRTVIDATAGLGRDAFLLACLGCHVTAVERSPVLALLLQDALDRAKNAGKPGLCKIIERFCVVPGEATKVLTNLAAAQRPDVVYLDPMYTPGESSALSKKEMRILRVLVGDDDDAGELFEVARRVARRRVVVKRHLRAPALASDADVTLKGRSVRYDVYHSRSAQPGPSDRNE